MPTKRRLKKGHADLGRALAVISDRLADVERRLGATPAEVAAIDAAADAEAAAIGPVEPDTDASTPVRENIVAMKGTLTQDGNAVTPRRRGSNRPSPEARSSGSISTCTTRDPTMTSRTC